VLNTVGIAVANMVSAIAPAMLCFEVLVQVCLGSATILIASDLIGRETVFCFKSGIVEIRPSRFLKSGAFGNRRLFM